MLRRSVLNDRHTFSHKMGSRQYLIGARVMGITGARGVGILADRRATAGRVVGTALRLLEAVVETVTGASLPGASWLRKCLLHGCVAVRACVSLCGWVGVDLRAERGCSFT